MPDSPSQPCISGVDVRGLSRRCPRGFALVATLALMILLTMVAVGLLSLSAISLRSSSQGKAQAEAQANARMALMLAIGELQTEMGPDMRVSAESALFDSNKNTETIEDVKQSRWLASYNAWGDWLNASYTPPGGSALKISDTYTPRRDKMFRRWLLSMPGAAEETNINFPMSLSGWDDSNSVVLVGQGSLGTSAVGTHLETRAYLTKVGDTGRHAWWIGPENHKARIDKAKRQRSLAMDQWETSQSDTAEVAAGSLPGFQSLDGNQAVGGKLITTQTLRPANVAEETVKEHFFDLTASSRGVLASVRTGHLKKDLSLLFEKPKSDLPSPYRFNSGDDREPSIRPMSREIADKVDKDGLKERHFAPWTRLRHFYRMYRQDSDAEAPGFPDGTPRSKSENGVPALSWDGGVPWTDCNESTAYHLSESDGQDSYTRFPIVTHITYVLSLKTEPLTSGKDKGKYQLRYVASVVYVLWNPYNVELRLPDQALFTFSYLAQVQPLQGWLYLKDGTRKPFPTLEFHDDKYELSSGSEDGGGGPDIVFKPGQFRIFSPRSLKLANDAIVEPGFDPQAYGGQYDSISGSYAKDQNPKFEFLTTWRTPANIKRNLLKGNTPGSFVAPFSWTTTRNSNDNTSRQTLPFNHHVDWFNTSQNETLITSAGGDPFALDNDLLPVGYVQLVLKGLHDHSYPTIGWEQDWRCRNWIQAPPFYLGKGLYISEDPSIANTQRIDSPYEFRFGLLFAAGKDVDDIVPSFGESAFMGPELSITAAPALELPTAPIGSLAGFSGMRVNPGWTRLGLLNSEWSRSDAPALENTTGNSLYGAESKVNAYQSGVTGPGIGNSFLHPMIPKTEVYRFLENSTSMDMVNRKDIAAGHTATKTKAYCDYWDHVLLLNDALWDDYFVSSLADQTRPGASASSSLAENLDKLVKGEDLANSRYMAHLGGRSPNEVKTELDDAEGYLKAAAYLMVDGMFNVNSTSVDAWHALFAGIRERQVVYRDRNGALRPVDVPSGKRIALSRFNTATTDQEGNDPASGVTRDDGMQAWSGVRFLDDDQLRKLAEECVKQVKRRGPFLNFSEFINRRLSDDDLGIMGALQSAIDYDDASPEAGSINYDFKSNSDFMLKKSDLGDHAFSTPEAAVGSRFAGIPGYVIQSDLLKPIANTLAVRDDTFRIRAYGDSRDKSGRILAQAWCEAIVQRIPEYVDDTNAPDIPARTMNANGEFSDINASQLTPANRLFGRKFQIEGFRWLHSSEI